MDPVPCIVFRSSNPTSLRNEWFRDEHGSSNNSRPQPFLVTNRRLSDVHNLYDFVGNPIDFFLLVPTSIGIETNIQCGGQHFRGEFFCVFTSVVVCLAVRM